MPLIILGAGLVIDTVLFMKRKRSAEESFLAEMPEGEGFEQQVIKSHGFSGKYGNRLSFMHWKPVSGLFHLGQPAGSGGSAVHAG